jgi:hypothetical protein
VAKSKKQKSQNATDAFPPNASKVLVYDAIATLNRDFEQVLSDLERLEGLHIFPRRWQRKFLKVWRATLEETRAWVNFEVVEVLHQKEEREWGSFARTRQRLEKPSEPPADMLCTRQIRRAEAPALNVTRFLSLRSRKPKFEGKAPEFRIGCHP